MKYSRVFVDAIGYELAPVVVTSAELEARLESTYKTLRIAPGQLEALTGIVERRWWEPGYSLSAGATAAARKALEASGVRSEQVDVVIYAGVCREQFEPATACRVAAELKVSPDAAVYDVSNACLGVLNGMVDVANRIELGQIRAGLVVSCESSRDINEIVIDRMRREPTMDVFKSSLATLTGGSGAVAVLLTDGSFDAPRPHRLVGGATQSAPQYHQFCRWGIENVLPPALAQRVEGLLNTALGQRLEALLESALTQRVVDVLPNPVAQQLKSVLPPGFYTQFMATDSISVLKYGVELGLKTWANFLRRVGWGGDLVDRVICHQVGTGHREAILKSLGIPPEKDFTTYEYLGNMGTVSLPLTAALADEREFLVPGNKVGFLGIGSGLNCLMLGLEW
jgi:3-oxoacyl-[acyl-carrier-protein] synthase-3